MAKLPAPPKGKGKPRTCVGGPFDKLDVLMPMQPDNSPMSLPIRVGEHVGRYNLNTGAWVPMEQQV